MNKEIFEKGDYVYYPQIGTKVYKLGERPFDSSVLTIITDENDIFTFRKDGRPHKLNEVKTRAIFKANAANRKLLSQLYGVEFEEIQDPLVEKLPHLCLVADDEESFEGVNTYGEMLCSGSDIRVVTFVAKDDAFPYKTENGNGYKFAKPCQILADGTIDFVE